MPGMVTASIEGGGSFFSRWARKIRRLNNMQRPMDKVLDLIEDSIINGVISDKTDVKGKPFTKLNRNYAARKTARFGSKPILVAEGEMINKKHFKKRATRKEGVIEYKAPRKIMTRALTHQEPITWKGPQREWWGLRTKVIPKIVATLGRYVRITVRG